METYTEISKYLKNKEKDAQWDALVEIHKLQP